MTVQTLRVETRQPIIYDLGNICEGVDKCKYAKKRETFEACADGRCTIEVCLTKSGEKIH